METIFEKMTFVDKIALAWVLGLVIALVYLAPQVFGAIVFLVISVLSILRLIYFLARRFIR